MVKKVTKTELKKTNVKKTEDKQLVDAKFLDKNGNTVNVIDIIDKEDCWFLRKEAKWIMTHKAIKRLAEIAGISKNFDVIESNNVIPDYRNELEHIVRVKIYCNAKDGKDGGCVHSSERELTITGEANRINTPNRGRGYLRKMAEKRAFDIAVLEHLGLYSSIFSEEEAHTYTPKKEPDLMPGTKDFEEITTEINHILNAKNISMLEKIAKKIKLGIDIKKYNDKQLKYLRELYQKEYGKKNKSF